MNRRLARLMRSEDGQGMTEYIIIVALIAISAITMITFYGQNLRDLFAVSANALAGNTSQAGQGHMNRHAIKMNLSEFATDHNAPP